MTRLIALRAACLPPTVARPRAASFHPAHTMKPEIVAHTALWIPDHSRQAPP